jgi:hypothetical protein
LESLEGRSKWRYESAASASSHKARTLLEAHLRRGHDRTNQLSLKPLTSHLSSAGDSGAGELESWKAGRLESEGWRVWSAGIINRPLSQHMFILYFMSRKEISIRIEISPLLE